MVLHLRPAARRWLALTALAATAGCASQPPPVRPPELETGTQYFAGSWLGEPRSEAAAAAPEQAWQVLLRCRHLTTLPDGDAFQPALALAELVTAEPTHHLLLPTSRFLADVRLAAGDVAGIADDGEHLGAIAAAALPGATTELSVRWRRLSEPGRTAGTLSARIDRSGQEARLALVSGRGASRETVLLRQRFAAGDRLSAIVPLGDGGDGLLIEWELRGTPASQFAAEAHRLLTGIAERRLAALRATPARQGETAAPAGTATLASEVVATAQLSQARSAMRALAQSVGAPLAEDLATVADQEAIERIASEVRAGTGSAPTTAALAFLLEQSSLLLLAGRVEREELSPIGDAVLLARTGALGRFPDRLRDAVARANDLPSLDQVIVEENQRLLRDTSPVHRVRAFDWLQRRHAAPAGYDPLASAAERHAALAAGEGAAVQGAGK